MQFAELADLVIADNKHVSGCHCVLNRGSTLKATLKDTSSNGTLLNHKRLRKGMEVSHTLLPSVHNVRMYIGGAGTQ